MHTSRSEGQRRPPGGQPGQGGRVARELSGTDDAVLTSWLNAR